MRADDGRELEHDGGMGAPVRLGDPSVAAFGLGMAVELERFDEALPEEASGKLLHQIGRLEVGGLASVEFADHALECGDAFLCGHRAGWDGRGGGLGGDRFRRGKGDGLAGQGGRRDRRRAWSS